MLSQIVSFKCPSCGEFINTGMSACRYCSAPIDHSAAEAAAEVQARVNQACSDASYLRVVAGTMLVFVGLRLIPFMERFGGCGFGLVFLATPILLLRWQAKFGGLQTNDPDYQKAKRDKNIAFVIWLAALPLLIMAAALIRIIGTLLIAG